MDGVNIFIAGIMRIFCKIVRIVRTYAGVPKTIVVDNIGKMLDGFVTMKSFC